MYSASGSNGVYTGRKRGRDFDDQASSNGRGGQYRRMDDSIAPYRGQDYSGYTAGAGGGGRPTRGFYGGGGNRRRNNRDRDRDGGSSNMLSVGEKYCADLWRFGDEIAVQSSAEEGSRFPSLNTEDIEALKMETREIWSKFGSSDILRGFRIAVAECPHKLAWLATLLGLLANEPLTLATAAAPSNKVAARPLVTMTNALDGTLSHSGGDTTAEKDSEMAPTTRPSTTTTPSTTVVNLGLEIVKDLVKAFQNHLDARRWRSVRFSLHLFAHLASLPKPLVDPQSLLSLLRDSFVSVLENEPGLRAERGDELVRVVLETLLRLAPSGSGGLDADSLEGIKSGIQGYMASRQLDTAFLASGTGNEAQWVDVSCSPADSMSETTTDRQFANFHRRFACTSSPLANPYPFECLLASFLHFSLYNAPRWLVHPPPLSFRIFLRSLLVYSQSASSSKPSSPRPRPYLPRSPCHTRNSPPCPWAARALLSPSSCPSSRSLSRKISTTPKAGLSPNLPPSCHLYLGRKAHRAGVVQGPEK